MKKLYPLFMCIMIAFGAVAQSINQSNSYSAGPVVENNMRFDYARYNGSKNKVINTASSQSVWFSYAVAMDSMNSHLGSTAGVKATYLFWDSLPLAQFGTNWSNVWLQHMGNVVDLTSLNLKNFGGVPAGWGTYNSYTVDSMSLIYAYTRRYPNTSIVDTLVVTLYTGTPATNYSPQYFTGTQLPTIMTDYGTDTLSMKVMKYAYLTNTPNATGAVTYKVPLTGADTAITYFREKFWSTNTFPVPAGNQLIFSTITFKPGYPYALNDTLNTKLNAFTFAAYEENGNNTYPFYRDCNLQSAACDYNCSGIVRTRERYNISTWNGYFLPKYAFTKPYSLENHLISYKVTSNNVGISEQSSDGNILYQNMPNPFNGNTVIMYELANGGNVSLEVYDITGKKMLAANEGKKASGKYTVELSSSSLPEGMYFYTLNVDGSRITRKMTVIK